MLIARLLLWIQRILADTLRNSWPFIVLVQRLKIH